MAVHVQLKGEPARAVQSQRVIEMWIAGAIGVQNVGEFIEAVQFLEERLGELSRERRVRSPRPTLSQVNLGNVRRLRKLGKRSRPGCERLIQILNGDFLRRGRVERIFSQCEISRAAFARFLFF